MTKDCHSSGRNPYDDDRNDASSPSLVRHFGATRTRGLCTPRSATLPKLVKWRSHLRLYRLRGRRLDQPRQFRAPRYRFHVPVDGEHIALSHLPRQRRDHNVQAGSLHGECLRSALRRRALAFSKRFLHRRMRRGRREPRRSGG